MMKHRMGMIVSLLGAAALATGQPAFSQQTQSQSQQQQTQQGQPAQQNQQMQKPSLMPGAAAQKPADLTPVDPKEEAAYKKFYGMKPVTSADFDNEIKSGEAFVKDYPQSRYLQVVYSRLANSYFEKQEFAKMYDAGDKALALNGDDVNVLTLLGTALSRGNSNDPDFAAKLAKAEQYERHALELIPTLPKPAELTDDQFAKIKAQAAIQAHSGLGIALFREQKPEEAAAELAQATTGTDKPDPADLFIYGLALDDMQKFSDAEKAFDTCMKITSSLQDRCKESEADAKAKAATQLQPPKQ
jgi:tetratricopeptide (TPR) repeat protein